jgi:ATP-dependent Lon protease
MPGRIVEGLAKAGVDNPVMLLDELDKLDSDWRGNPSAALMEVLDPAHNHAFRDNYLETEYDLSRVFFVATANDVDAIPATLYDRLEVIYLSGYTMPEKLAIARRHLLPRVARDTGLGRGDVRFGRGALRAVVRGYTREAGVRELERSLRRIDRKVARKHLEDALSLPVTIGTGDLRGYLGEAHWLEAELPRQARVGESLGLAYTSDGGEVLTIEAAIARGRGELVLTGQLGDVMQESGSAAWGYLLAHVERDTDLKRLIDRSPFLAAEGLDLAGQDVRVHVPEGAVPKDGPSAGLALAVAMLSALGDEPVKPRVAMTGEITLAGRILRVGGLKEKLLAAGRSGVRTVVLPAANRGTIEELPADLTDKLELVYVASFREALPHVFRAGVFTRRASKRHGQASGTLGATDMHDHEHEHDHQTPGSTEEPGVDAGSGTLEMHCSQCGALIEGSHEFCQVCAIESSGGELPEDDRAQKD